MNIKFYSIAKDAWEAGDFQICDECHAHIRHVMEINGTPYGCDCGANKAGWTTGKAKKVMTKVDTYKQFLNGCDRIDSAYQWAASIINVLKLEIPFTTEAEVVEIVKAIVN